MSIEDEPVFEISVPQAENNETGDDTQSATISNRSSIEVGKSNRFKRKKDNDSSPVSSSAVATFGKIIGGDFLMTKGGRKILPILITLVFLSLVYIASRYQCQQDMIIIDTLTEELVDARQRAMTCSSDLTEKCRESNLIKMLQQKGDSLLKYQNTPPFIIEVPQKK